VTLLDAYPLLALLLEEPAAQEVQGILAEQDAAISAVNLTEALDLAQRRNDIPEHALARALAPLRTVLEILPVEEKHAWRAADLRARYYDRRERAVSLADCLLVASAAAGDRIATSDLAVAEVVRAEAIPIVALPDSAGVRP